METKLDENNGKLISHSSDTKYRDIADGNPPSAVPRVHHRVKSDTKYRDIADGNAMPKLSSVMS